MFVSKLMVRALLTELQARGLEPTALISDSATWLRSQYDPRACLEGQDLDLFIERAYQYSRDPALGFTLGRQSPETALLVLGHVLLTCPTVRETFGSLCR